MRRFHLTFSAAILFLMISISACAPKSQAVIAEGPPLAATREVTAEPVITEEPTEPASSEVSAEPQLPDFDANSFDNPTRIDNEWMPMQPGMKWSYEGVAMDDEGNSVMRRIEFTVTDLTKEIGRAHV